MTLEAIGGSGNGDGGVRHGDLLVRLTEAMWEGEPGPLAVVRDELLAVAGADVLGADPTDTPGCGQVVSTPLDVYGSDGFTKPESW